MENLAQLYDYMYMGILWVLAIMAVFCLIRAIIGPKVADRVVAVNMIGTLVLVMIAVLAFYMNEFYLLDIGIIYAMISFLAVVILTKIIIGVYAEKKNRMEEESRKEES